MKIIAALLALTLLLPAVYAADFSEYKVDYNAEKSLVTIRFEIELNQTNGLDVSIFTKPTDLQVQTSVPSKFSVKEENGWNVAIDFLQPATGKINVTLSFRASLIEELKDRDLFTFVFQSPGKIDNFVLSLTIPQGSSVYRINDRPVVSPDAEITTNGENIILVWRDSLSPGSERVYLASYTTQTDSFLFPALLIGALFAVSAFAIYMYTHKKSKRIVYKSLSEDEQIVYEIVKKENGMTQDKVRDLSGFSKSKLSKVVRNLEHKGIIKKTPYKKTNKLEIKI